MLYGDHEATPGTPNCTGLVALNLSHVILKRLVKKCCCECHRIYIYTKKSVKFGLYFPSQFVFQALHYIWSMNSTMDFFRVQYVLPDRVYEANTCLFEEKVDLGMMK